MKRKLRKKDRVAQKTGEVTMVLLAGERYPKGTTKNEVKKIMRRAAKK